MLWRYAPLVLWIGVIFYLSSDQGSMSRTSRFVRPVLEFLFPAASDETLQFYHGYVRKAGHFTGYAVLAFWAVRAFVSSLMAAVSEYRHLWAVLLVAAVATVDELNQSFLSSRTGSVWDVLLDISGGVAMAGFLWAIGRPRQLKTPS
jgi:VanZ family protein